MLPKNISQNSFNPVGGTNELDIIIVPTFGAYFVILFKSKAQQQRNEEREQNTKKKCFNILENFPLRTYQMYYSLRRLCKIH